MTTTTRDQFLSAAEHLFAEKGFYGASIATIAKELGLTKQALLHHFGSKEKLYGEVLQNISDRLAATIDEIRHAHDSPARQLEEMLLAQYRDQMADQDSARLIMQELLDNEQRADKAGNWYLKGYLETLVDTVRSIDTTITRSQALAMVYQLLGAAHYFAVSQPTLGMIFGKSVLAKTRSCYEDELRQLIRSRLA
jgi:AcrR family transcriptional regulator